MKKTPFGEILGKKICRDSIKCVKLRYNIKKQNIYTNFCNSKFARYEKYS